MRYAFVTGVDLPSVKLVEASDPVSMQANVLTALGEIAAEDVDNQITAIDLAGCGNGTDFVTRIEYTHETNADPILAEPGVEVGIRTAPFASTVSVQAYSATNSVELANARSRTTGNVMPLGAKLIGVEFTGSSHDRVIMALEVFETQPV